MSMGIRIFDIRCRNFDDVLHIHHGSYYFNSTFNDVLKETTDYLGAHPREFVIMNIQKEYEVPERLSTKVNRHLANYSSFMLGADYSDERQNSHTGQVFSQRSIS